MSLLTNAEDKRHVTVPKGQEFILDNDELSIEERTLRSLDDLSEAINLIDPETFQKHVNAEKNDFASWVEHVFGEEKLADDLRRFPTPLRMMVSIEKFLRQVTTIGEPQATPAPEAKPSDEVAQ